MISFYCSYTAHFIQCGVLFSDTYRLLFPIPFLLTPPSLRIYQGAYQQEILYWTRLVLILVGLVSAIVIWCIVKLSELLLVTKNDFVTNPIQYDNNYNYTTFSSSNTDMTNLSTSNFLTDGFGNVNVTAASDAATDFVINNGADNGTNYYGLSSFAYFIGFNMLFTFLAFIPVAYRPVSGGSGIAEAKATLNGTYVCRDYVTVRYLEGKCFLLYLSIEHLFFTSDLLFTIFFFSIFQFLLYSYRTI